ncbi:MAG: o-succinylbenzoate synthase [Prevotella sp.]|nr:o-succinylbenzoate synthase [Prevotella sp.]
MKYHCHIYRQTFRFKEPAGTSRGVYLEKKSYIVELTDDAGRRGLGECSPLPGLSCDALPDYEEILKDCCNLVCVTGRTDFDEMRPYPSMTFGLETAVRHLEAGSFRLFDTAFGRGEAGIPINGLVWMGRFDEMQRRLEEKLRQDFRCIKFKIGAIDFDDELRLLRHVRNRFTPEEVEIRVDANGAFTPEEALGKLEALHPFAIHSIEQPIRPTWRDDNAARPWDNMARICRESPVPVALDEELIGAIRLPQKQELLDAVRPQYLVLKPSLHGGMQGVTEWVEEARKRNIGTWMTSALESNIGLNAVAHLAAKLYGDNITMPQGLGTGALFTENHPVPIELRGDRMWFVG